MLMLLQPVLTLLVGIAMAIYGVVHAYGRFPGGQAFHVLVVSLPAISSVILFLLGILAFIVGVCLTVTGTRSLRERWQRFNHIARHAAGRPQYDEDEERWAGAYR